MVALLVEVERRDCIWRWFTGRCSWSHAPAAVVRTGRVESASARPAQRGDFRECWICLPRASSRSRASISLAPHLTDDTVESMLEAASGRSARDVQKLIAAWHPQPDLPTTLRALPRRGPCMEASSLGPLLATEVAGDRSRAPRFRNGGAIRTGMILARSRPRTIVAPIAPTRYLLKVTIGQDTHDKLQRARALLRHSIPDGDTDQILNRALSLPLDDVIRTKCANVEAPAGRATMDEADTFRRR